jgi:exodeoxyribonuclease VII large subunit
MNKQPPKHPLRTQSLSESASAHGSDGELPLFADIAPKHWTVSELTTRIRGVLEPAFRDVWVQGEVSNCRPAASGHVYFSLKDENASISIALFGWGKAGGAKRSFEIKDGLQILCRGKVSVYAPRGGYQLIAEHVEPLGAGALQIAFEQLKERLAAEGLFDSRKKRPLPSHPKSIAVITSPSGAVIQDMLNILRRRAPHLKIVVIPALVQGDEAPRHLIRGIEAANRLSLGEVIVLARGGGSMEDLWCFNDEALARAISSSRLPIVSAVGHEIDFTISDFTADLRAPTPSAAAEILSGGWVDAGAQVRDAGSRLLSAVQRDLAQRLKLLEYLAARVVSPRDRLREQSQRCDELAMRLERALRMQMERKGAALEQCAGKLDALSPLRVLERGYTLVREAGELGRVVRSAADVRPGQKLKVTFHDGNHVVQAV